MVYNHSVEIKDAYEEIFGNIQKVLIVLAHPDDMEIICGGLVARLLESHKNVRLVVTTNGGKGTKDKTGISEAEFGKARVTEQIAGAKELGIPDTEVFNLELPDGEVETTIANIEKIVFHIRQFKPELVITHNPHDLIIEYYDGSFWVNHRDHRNTALLTLDAMYPYSRDTNFFPAQLETVQTHKVTKLLISDSYTKKELKKFEVTKQSDKKRKALAQHISAIKPEAVEGYLDEIKSNTYYFEPLAYYEIY